MAAFTALTLRSSEQSNRPNKSSQRRPEREATAAKMFSAEKSIKYIGVIPETARKDLAKNLGIDLGEIGKISPSEPGKARCALCQGVHTLTSPHRSVKIAFFQNLKSKEIFALSETCREDYFGQYATKSLTNPADYAKDYPKAQPRDPKNQVVPSTEVKK